MTAPVRLQLRRALGVKHHAPTQATKRQPARVVGRPGPGRNPFVVGKHGDAAYCVDLYRAMLAGLMRVGRDPDIEALAQIRDHVERHGHELRGHNLACWCKPGAPCHGDVLIDIVNRPICEEVAT